MKTADLIPRAESRAVDRRELLQGLGAAGLALLLGPACSDTPAPGAGQDKGGEILGADRGTPPDMPRVIPPDAGPAGADGGPPAIDLAAPAVTQTATFALG